MADSEVDLLNVLIKEEWVEPKAPDDNENGETMSPEGNSTNVPDATASTSSQLPCVEFKMHKRGIHCIPPPRLMLTLPKRPGDRTYSKRKPVVEIVEPEPNPPAKRVVENPIIHEDEIEEIHPIKSVDSKDFACEVKIVLDEKASSEISAEEFQRLAKAKYWRFCKLARKDIIKAKFMGRDPLGLLEEDMSKPNPKYDPTIFRSYVEKLRFMRREDMEDFLEREKDKNERKAIEARKRRSIASSAYSAWKRHNETPEEREKRLELIRQQYRMKMAGMSLEELERYREMVRRCQKRSKKYMTPYSELPEEKKEKMRELQRQRTRNETPEQRQKRLERFKLRQHRVKEIQILMKTGLTEKEAEAQLRQSRPDLFPVPKTKSEGERKIRPYKPWDDTKKRNTINMGRRARPLPDEKLKEFDVRARERMERQRKLEKISLLAKPLTSEDDDSVSSSGFGDWKDTVVVASRSSLIKYEAKITPDTENLSSETKVAVASFGLEGTSSAVGNAEPDPLEVSDACLVEKLSSRISEESNDPLSTSTNIEERNDSEETPECPVTPSFIDEDDDISFDGFTDDHEITGGTDLNTMDGGKAFLAITSEPKTDVGVPSSSTPSIQPECSGTKKGESIVKQGSCDNGKETKNSDGKATENSDGLFCCNVQLCGKLFKTRVGLKVHIGRDHVDESSKSYSCPKADCTSKFATSSLLWTHYIRYHDPGKKPPSERGKNQYKAPLKDKTIPTKRVREVKMEICQLCGKKMHYGQLQRHIKAIHSDTISYLKCDYCDRQFKQKCTLDDHVRRVHLGMVNRCDECGREFQSAVKLWKHQVDAHGMEDLDPSSVANVQVKVCPYCGLKLFRGMAVHVDKEHPERLSEYLSSSTATSQQTSEREQRQDTRQRTWQSEQGGIRTGSKPHKPASCEICGKTYTRKFNLNDHIRREHEQRRIRTKLHNPASCEFCGKTFTRKYNLNDHIRREHELDRKLKMSGENSDIPQTEITNSSEDQAAFNCGLCSKSFIYVEDFIRHALFNHPGLLRKIVPYMIDRPVKCHFCCQKQEDLYLFKLHIMEEHSLPFVEYFQGRINEVLSKRRKGRKRGNNRLPKRDTRFRKRQRKSSNLSDDDEDYYSPYSGPDQTCKKRKSRRGSKNPALDEVCYEILQRFPEVQRKTPVVLLERIAVPEIKKNS